MTLLREELRKKEAVSHRSYLCHLLSGSVVLLFYKLQQSLQMEKNQKSLSEQLEAKSQEAPHALIGQCVEVANHRVFPQMSVINKQSGWAIIEWRIWSFNLLQRLQWKKQKT